MDIQSILTQVANHWDNRQFEQAKVYFDGVVQIDYTSLGAPTITMDPIDQLCQNWKMVLSGFDQTKHTVIVQSIEEENDEYIVISKVNAYHFIADIADGSEWILDGQYTHKLKNIDGQLKIQSMKLDVTEQQGNLKLILEATKRTMK